MQSTSCLAVADATLVGGARRRLAQLATELEFDETQAGKLAIIVTELANNLVKYAKDGLLLWRTIPEGIELIALDKGPGMDDIARCLRDGYSTAGTPGTGLGAVRRLSTLFDIHSQPGVGTVIVSQLSAQSSRPSAEGASRFIVGAVNLAMQGEEVCGDSWHFRSAAERLGVLIADGLGHGRFAAEASLGAVASFDAAFDDGPGTSVTEIVRTAHLALKGTRGAAVGAAFLQAGDDKVRFAGIGNTAAVVLNPSSRSHHLISQNGTAGVASPRISEFSQPWKQGSVLVLQTDGIQTRWDLDRYPGLLSRHPSVIAGVIFRDFLRGNDDTTVIVVKERAERFP